MTKTLLIASIVLTGIVIAKPAAAQVPSDGIIYACVQGDQGKDDGKFMRLVTSGEACRPNETRIQWNVSGPAGEAGPQGVAGPVGPIGPAGAI
jgi:hypothetical protein